jgi:hypothetical protein
MNYHTLTLKMTEKLILMSTMATGTTSLIKRNFTVPIKI